MVPSLNAIHEFMAQENVVIITDNSDPKNYCSSLKDKLQRCGYVVKYIRPSLDDFDEEGRCLCVHKLPASFSALIIDLNPGAASIIMDEAIIKGIDHVWLLQKSYNSILREKAADNQINLIFNQNILNYLEIPKSIHRLYVNYEKYAVAGVTRK
ncbi:MAG: CoA-binding protein [Bacteroidales bacterium]